MSLLPIFQNRPPDGDSKLVGIAKLAAQGEAIREGHNIEYFTINTRSILNRCSVPYMPFSWTVNPYRGCEFACKYCYARYTHEFMEMHDGLDFERKIYVKQHVEAQLHRDLKKVKAGEQIAIGTATDPFQPAERRFEITRSILQGLTKYDGLDISIVTKSDLVLRDIDLLQKIAERNDLYVNVTVTTPDVNLARILEPRAPRPDLRLNAVRILNREGVPAGVIGAPVLPGITDSPAALDRLVRAAKEHNARYVYANPLFLKPCSAAVFMPFLEKEFPHLVEQYRQRYGGRAYLPETYRKRISELMKKLRVKHGFAEFAPRMAKSGERGVSPDVVSELRKKSASTQIEMFQKTA